LAIIFSLLPGTERTDRRNRTIAIAPLFR
jgi:hypothetical protein